MELFYKVCRLIDKIPEFPYFLLAMGYALTIPRDLAIHVFSTAFIFIVMTIAVGLILKSIFKQKRPREHYDIPVLKYDFPSLHSMVSIGATVYVYFVSPLSSVLLCPMGLIYLYSRVRLRVHSVKGVIGGALIGIIMGLMTGTFILGVYLPYNVELILAIFFFIFPVILSIFRITFKSKIDKNGTPKN